MLKRLTIVIIGFFASFLMQAQKPVSIHFSENEGLPEKEIYKVVEAKDGVLWLATHSGVYSYDGNEFTLYRHPDQRGPSAFGIKFDDKGRLWYATMNSQLYYVENGKVHFFKDLKKKVGSKVLECEIVNDSTLFVNAYNGFYNIDINTRKVSKINIENLEEYHSSIHNFKGKDYIFSGDALNELIGDSLKPLFGLDKETPRLRLTTLFSTDKHLYVRFLIDNKNTFYKVDASGIKPFSAFNAIDRVSINYLKQMGPSFWFFTANGAYQYSMKGNEMVLENHYLKEKNVTDLILDRNGNYIFSTINNGLYILPNPSVEVLRNETFKDGVISSFVAINDSLANYISNHNELHSLNLKGKKNEGRKIDRFLNQTLYYDSLKEEGLLFNNSELELYDPINLKISKKVFEEAPKNITRLNDSTYISTHYNRTKIIGNNLEYKKIFHGRSKELASTKSGHLYITTPEGVKWASNAENDLERTTQNGKGFYSNGIVNQKDTDMVWVSRPNWGIYLVESGKIIKSIYMSNGLLDKTVTAMDSNEEELWIATNKGIQRYDYETESFTNFGMRDGIIQPRILKLQVTNGYVWYQTVTGIYRFPINKKKKPIFVPEVHFSRIKIANKPQDLKDYYRIDYNANTLDIGFMVNGFKSLEQYQFEYSIEGLNPEWISLEKGKHNVNFNSLPSGKYTFKVRAKDAFEGIYTNPIHFKVNVALPFWKRWWFSLLVAIIAITGMLTFFKIKGKRKEELRKKEFKQVEVERQLVALKLENLRSQMNPHFIFNALNSIQEYIMLNQKKMASDYLGKFADLMRTYLNHSKKGNITLQEEIDCIRMYLELEKLRFEDKMDYAVNISGVLSPNEISIPTMLVQPYIENALKHGLLHRKTNRRLQIDFLVSDVTKTIRCVIVDNGIGRDKAKEYKARSRKQHKPFATRATEDRLNLINYGKEKRAGVTITDLFEGEEPSGTQVDIIIPFTTL